MPRYKYFCPDCAQEFILYHAMHEVITVCSHCESKQIQKLLTKPFHIEKKVSKIGSITKRYIEDNKKILEDLKKEGKS